MWCARKINKLFIPEPQTPSWSQAGSDRDACLSRPVDDPAAYSSGIMLQKPPWACSVLAAWAVLGCTWHPAPLCGSSVLNNKGKATALIITVATTYWVFTKHQQGTINPLPAVFVQSLPPHVRLITASVWSNRCAHMLWRWPSQALRGVDELGFCLGLSDSNRCSFN